MADQKFTKQEIIEVYGKIEMKFVHYAKQVFTFEGAYNQGKIGGQSGKIHTLEVSDQPVLLKDLIPSLNMVHFYDEEGVLKNTIELTNQE